MVSIVRTAGNFEGLALAQDLPLTRSQHPRQYHCWFIEVVTSQEQGENLCTLFVCEVSAKKNKH